MEPFHISVGVAITDQHGGAWNADDGESPLPPDSQRRDVTPIRPNGVLVGSDRVIQVPRVAESQRDPRADDN